MPLPTLAMKQALKAHIQANSTSIAYSGGNAAISAVFAQESLNAGDAEFIAQWYNLLTSPLQYAWQNVRSRMDCRRAVMNTVGSANQLDALSASKRDALLWAIDDVIDCRLAAVRTSIDDLCGSQNVLKAAILDSFKRQLKNIEKVFSTGGAGTLVSPHDYVFEGTVTGNDISDLRGIS